MAKALNVGHREALFSHAQMLVRQTADTAALDAAYDACAIVISGVVKKAYPPADMEILAKYNRAEFDKCIFVSTGGSNYERFTFRQDDDRTPRRPGGNCNFNRPHLLDAEQERVWDTYQTANKAHEASVKSRDADYRALIYVSRTFEELVAIWPAADALRERILGTSRAVAVMSEEVLARIRADAAVAIAGE